VKSIKFFLCASAALSMYGCANIQAPAPQASAGNVSAAKQLGAPVKVGAFKLADGVNPDADKSVSLRGANTLNAPSGKGFSGYLRDVLMTELTAAGKLDEASGITITGELTKTELEAGMSTGAGTLGARFKVTRADGVCLDKELVVSATWESSVMAAVAVPTAFNHYTALYPELAGKLLKDGDFRQRCVAQR